MRHLVSAGLLVLGLLSWTPFALSAQPSAGDSLSLEEALRLAEERNFGVRIARNEAEVAGTNARFARGAFFPSLTASLGQFNTLANTDQVYSGDRPPVSRSGAFSNRLNSGLLLNWTVFDGLGMFAASDRLRALRDLGEVNVERSLEAAAAEVVIAYFDIVRQQEQVKVYREAVEISEERMRIAALRRDVGSGSELELLRAQVDLNADRAQLLRQESALATAKIGLNELLARPELGEGYAVSDTIRVARFDAPEELVRSALAANTRLEGARRSRIASEYARREILAERLPRVDLQLGYDYLSSQAAVGLVTENRSASLNYGVAVSFDLFDRFDRRRRLTNAGLQLRNDQLAIEEIELQLRSDVARAFRSYETSLALIELERQNRISAARNVEVALERFRLGAFTSVELREVQRTLVDAESRLIAAQFEAKRAETELLRLAGRLTDSAAR